MSHTFECMMVRCKQRDHHGDKCDNATRLLRLTPLDTETSQINSPTVSEPLFVVCNGCWKYLVILKTSLKRDCSQTSRYLHIPLFIRFTSYAV
jgi:hypothetical protein